MTANGDRKLHTIVVLVENKAGVLARVAGLFARRGFNIESLAVAPTDDETLSRLTIVVDLASAPLEQIVKQTLKLINVVVVRELDPAVSTERELILVTVSVPEAERSGMWETIDDFDAIELASSDTHVTLSFSGRPERVDAFEDLMRTFGIEDIQRTGRVALPRLA